MNILITAIGSMSAECVIKQLKTQLHTIIGIDIYPEDWHIESKLCDYFYQVPYATDKEYCSRLLDICEKHNIDFIIPLTDLEIDVLSKCRNLFKTIFCMPDNNIIATVRNKYNLYKKFENNIPLIKTKLLSEYTEYNNDIIIKPIMGRSSQNIIKKPSINEFNAIIDRDNYIVQDYINGPICTVDYCRSAKYKTEVIIAREELIRTVNGAGLTVKMFNDDKLNQLVSYIGNSLNINGTVCIEFIKSTEYYLIDFNPRFSAGIDFSLRCGYDMVKNHIKCFTNHDIDQQINIPEKIFIKKFITI